MAPVIMLDTHVALWLYTGKIEYLSQRAQRKIDESDLVVSPIVELELAYLNEIGRVTDTAQQILGALGSRMGLTVAQIGFGPLCATAVEVTWTRDPFDRMLVAHAITAGLPLLTKDASILANLDLAFWD